MRPWIKDIYYHMCKLKANADDLYIIKPHTRLYTDKFIRTWKRRGDLRSSWIRIKLKNALKKLDKS